MEKKTKNVFSVLVIAFVLVIGTANVVMVVGSAEGSAEPMFEVDEDNETIVLTNAHTEDEVSTLSGYGEVIDHYGSNLLIRTDRLTARELENEFGAQRLDYRNEISVKGHTFDTNQGLPELDSELTIDSYDSGTEGIYIVDMIGPVNPEWRERIEDVGADVINYQPNYAYEVVMTPEQADDIKDFEFVDWVGVYQPEFKLHNQLEEALDEEMPVTVRLRPGFETDTLNGLEYDLEILGMEDLKNQGARLTVDVDSMVEIERLALESDVYYISPYLEPELHAEMDIQLIGGGQWFMDDEYETRTDLDPEPREGDPQEPYRRYGDHGAYINQLGYSGEDITIATADTGLGDGTVGDAGHEDFTDRVIGGYGFEQEDEWQDGHYHGTAVTGLVAGDTYRGTGMTWDETADGDMEYYMGQGLASESDIFATKIFTDGGSFIPQEYYPIVEEPAQRSDAYVHSNSWGASTMGEYTDSDEIFDQAVRDADRDDDQNVPMVITTSAGNDGGRGNYEQEIGSPANAKNVITIGGTQPYNPGFGHHNPEQMADFSSRGWTEDNRVKPDLVAPSESILTQNTPLDGGGYIASDGTSFGNPLVAGAATIVVDWYEERYEEKPSPAMVRSILINTANEMDPDIGDTTHVPNRDEGWGIPDLSKLEYPESDPLGFQLEDQESLITTGEVNEYNINYQSKEEPLKITLAWTDEHAMEGDSAGGAPTLKNNLDLEVETPTGEVIRGNAFDLSGDGMSDDGYTYPEAEVMEDFDYTENGWDDVNNVQNVYIHPDELEEGEYTVRIHGTNVPEDANNDGYPNQDYALTAYNVPDVLVPRREGEVMFDRDEYSGEDVVTITLSDSILEGEGTYNIDVSSLDGEGTELENKTVELVEDDNTLGLFEGYVQLTEDEEEEDALYVEHDGEIKAWYWDEDPGPLNEMDTEDTESESMSITETLSQTIEDDVGVTEIVSPQDKVNTETQEVEVKVTNFGENDQTDVPVNTTMIQEARLVYEDFEDEIPDEWTIDNATEESWHHGENENHYALVEDDRFLDQEEWLITPVFDATDADGTMFQIDQYFSDGMYGDPAGEVLLTTDGGDNWEEIDTYTDTTEGKEYDISDLADGEEEVQVAFVYDTDDHSDWGATDYWEIYEVNIYYMADEYFDETYVDIDSGEEISVEFEDWTPSSEGKFIMNSTTDLEGDEDPTNDYEYKEITVADVHDVGVSEVLSPAEKVNSEEEHPVEVLVKNYGTIDQSDVPVEVSIFLDGETEEYTDDTTVNVDAKETTVAELDDWYPDEKSEYLMNASTDLEGDEDQTNVYETLNISVVDINDVGVTDIFSPTDEVILDDSHEVKAGVENFGTFDEFDVPVNAIIEEKLYLLDEAFEEDIPDDWTIDNTSDETWHHEENMAYVEDDLNEKQEEWLITPKIDATVAEGTQLEIDQDFYNSTTAGVSYGEVMISSDGGENWERIDKYTGTVEEKVYDISDYSDGEDDLQIAFVFNAPEDTGWVAYDDWEINEVNIVQYEEGEYSDSTTMDIYAMSRENVSLTDWDPSDTGEYRVNISTDLEGDEDPTNDYETEMVQVVDPEHDIGIDKIVSPESLVWDETQSVKAEVTNYGDFDEENVPIYATGEKLVGVKEDFSGEFPPEGWETDDWHQEDSDRAGGEPPEAQIHFTEVEGDYSYLRTPSFDTRNTDELSLEFKSRVQHYTESFDARVLVRSNRRVDWTDVTPWENPVTEDVGPDTYEVDITEHIGSGTQIMFEFEGHYFNLDRWSVDDVHYGFYEKEYSDEIEIDLDEGESTDIEFEDWNPEATGIEGNYLFNVTAQHPDEDNPENSTVEKEVQVREKIYDLEATSIDAPIVEPIYQYEEEVLGTVTNRGNQKISDTPVEMTIEPPKRETPLDEDFSDGLPDNWTVEDRNGNENTWEFDEENEVMVVTSEDDSENNVLWTEIANCSKGGQNVFLEFYSNFEGQNERDLLISTDGGETYQKIGSNIGEGEVTHDITQWAAEKEEVMIGWEFYSEEATEDDYWLIDDVKITVEYTEKEYQSTAHIDELNTNESKQLEFDNWTPGEYPSEYIITMTTLLEKDDNPENTEIIERIFVEEHSPPEKPTDPNPKDGEEGITHSPYLNVTVYGDEKLDLNATFYLYDEEENKIGEETASELSSGEEAEVQFLNLEANSTFEWYVEVEDGIENVTSETWEFHTYEPEGVWKTASAAINTEPPEPVENLTVDWNAEILDVDGNELTWNASPDDGAGANDTDYYMIYRSSCPSGPWDETTAITSVFADGSESYTYLDDGKAHDGEVWHYVVRAVDRVGNMEMNEVVVSEMPVPTATDPEPAEGAEVEELDQTVAVDVTSPTGEPLNVEFYHGSTRDLLASYDGVTNETLEADYVELDVEDMGQDHYWYVMATYEDHNVGSINPPETYELWIEEPDGEGDVYLDGELVEPESWPYIKEYEEFTEVNLEASPAEGVWYFDEWKGDVPENIAENKEITLEMNKDRSVEANFLDGHWHWLYEADHRTPADTAAGMNEPDIWYGAITLNLSDNIGQELSEVAYYDWEEGAHYAKAHIAEDEDGAPGEWLSSTDSYEPVGAGWVELELNENVEIEEPGDYWIVMEFDDMGALHHPFGVIHPPVEDGQYMNMDDPHDPDHWQDLSDDLGINYAWALEAFVKLPEEDGEKESIRSDGLASLEEKYDVAVIDDTPDDDDNYGQEWADLLDKELPETYNVEHVHSDDALADIDAYQSYFVHGLAEENEEEWFNKTDDVGTIYTSLYVGPETLDQRSEVIGDPEEVIQDTGLPTWTITDNHTILEGVAEPGDEVLIHEDHWEDRASFTDTSAEVYAEAEDGNNAFGVDDDREDVLLTIIGFNTFTYNELTDEAIDILTNSIEYLTDEPTPLGWHFHLKDTVDPIADAGEDIEAYQGDTITLDGTDSYNPPEESEITEYVWTVEDPTGKETILQGSTVEYDLEYALNYDVTLRVYDEYGNNNTDTMQIYAIDTEEPVADTGPSYDITRVGSEYTLDGTGSTDNVGIVNYTWSIEGVSEEAQEREYEDTVYGETVDYVFPYEGTYEVILEISDAEDNTDTDSITIMVEPALYDLTIEIEGEGTVDIYPHTDGYEEGTEIDLNAVPDQGWKFVQWTGDYEGTDKEMTIEMDEDKEITAHFEIKTYTLNVETVGEGEIEIDSDQEEYEHGEEVDLTAVPEEGWKLKAWTGDYGSTEEEITITMDTDKELTAHFEEVVVDTYELTVNVEGEGAVDIDPEQEEYEAGTDVTLTADPDEDWIFAMWTGDHGSVEEEITITMNSDKELTANFEEEIDPAYFEVEITDYDEEVEEGDTITVDFMVENTGEVKGTQTIVFNVDGDEVDSTEMTIGAGETEESEFTWEAGEPGDYDLEVASEDEDNWVTVTVEEDDAIPGFTLALLILGAVISVAIYYKKYK